MKMLAVFKSRSQSLDCLAHLKRLGVPAQTVSTPKDAGMGCGISIKFDSAALPRVKLLLTKRPYSSFAGFMRERGMGFVFI